ncbi:MAG: methionine--tRNA ligase [bacterium]|nr:methionine--tRNA ligase [bacterium]
MKLVVTSALPYANGPIHLGHLVEYIQTDIYVRFLRLAGEQVIYCCADDTHGAPIEINAYKLGITPQELIARSFQEHTEDFEKFQISFDSYYSTNSPENKEFSDLIFSRLRDKGDIYQKVVELSYCPKCQRFLPDRYVRGTCPRCGAHDQYGDNCEVCNATYATTDLIDPYCAICKSVPARKESEHYFFRLSSYTDRLRAWLLENKNLQDEIKNYILNWVDAGLKDWDITRDAPYFGFQILDDPTKYYYVWLDAPIGYMASTKHYCQTHGDDFDSYWVKDTGRIIHFIGKDIIYFHFLFWPAVLMGSGFRLPENIVVHGFLTVNKERMSKSRGTFITAREYWQKADPSYLRFYFAANLSHSIADIDFDLNDFKDRINSELLGNVANLANRSLNFLKNKLNGKIATADEGEYRALYDQKVPAIIDSYYKFEFRSAIRGILELSDFANKYFQHAEPWKKIKESEQEAARIVSTCVHWVRDLAILLKPVIPLICQKLEQQLNLPDLTLQDLGQSLTGHTIADPQPLVQRIDNLTLIGKGIS